VHFPIALLVAGAGAELAARLRPAAREPLTAAASWALFLGAASAWVAVGLGLLAEETAAHVPPAWETLARHESLAYWTAGAFTALAAWRWRAPRRARGLFLAAWLAACALLAATAQQGGELVYRFGMGVAR
jgi:uncharacterized membrane protein